MQKNVIIARNLFIEDLCTGYSLVNFDRTVSVEDGNEVIVAGEQYRVKNPANYGSIVNAVVKENYGNGADEAALRKGILNPLDADFIGFNGFVEMIKLKCKNEGI